LKTKAEDKNQGTLEGWLMGYGAPEPERTFRCPCFYRPTAREIYKTRREDRPLPGEELQCLAEFERQEELDRHLRLAAKRGGEVHWTLKWDRNGRHTLLRKATPPKNLAWKEWQLETGKGDAQFLE
jgi:hypothetical protein